MPNIIIICEKPSVAQEYQKVLNLQSSEKHDGYMVGTCSMFPGKSVAITWTIGHLCTLSLPPVYGEEYKRWSLDTLPFLPEQYKYEVISNVKKQFSIVKKLYHSSDLERLYLAGDSGREGLYIQALVRQLAGTKPGIEVRVVWIDSQTEQEIKRGLAEAKVLSEYATKSESGYMRAIEDYAVGINFSRVLSCKHGWDFNKRIGTPKGQWKPIAVGRVMSCVLGMIVEREREIRSFVETPFYKIEADCGFKTEWKAVETSFYYESPLLYNESGFKAIENANLLLSTLDKAPQLCVESVVVKEERKKAPLLFNLAELQFECSKKYKISPDQTLDIAQKLYEGKLITYPRTDARVLSTAIADDISFNLNGLVKQGYKKDQILKIAQNGWHKGLSKTHYTDDSKITDHYAIIPTGSGAGDVDSLTEIQRKVYYDIVNRFISIFYPSAVYEKAEVVLKHNIGEKFFGSMKTIKSLGYMEVLDDKPDMEENLLAKVKESQAFNATFEIKEGKTTPPKRYSSGSIILAMENAGKLIEDQVLREQIKSSGIGTSATRAEIIKKLEKNEYINLNKKTQILTPTLPGECIYDILEATMPQLLSPEMTAEWEKGLVGIENGDVLPANYRNELEEYIRSTVDKVKGSEKVTYKSTETVKESTDNSDIICPICKKGRVVEHSKGFGCSEYRESGCTFTIWKNVAGKMLTMKQVAKLVRGEKTGVIKGFKKKDGSTFDAALQYKDGKLEFVSSKKKEDKPKS